MGSMCISMGMGSRVDQYNIGYEQKVKGRSFIRFHLGLIIRLKTYIKFFIFKTVAQLNGATIGKNSVIPLSLALKANENLSIGSNSIINSEKIDLRDKIEIGDNVIIGNGVEIIRMSHDLDDQSWRTKSNPLKICDYSWLATEAMILPSCKIIGIGGVAAARAVVVSDVDEFSVVGGNPSCEIKKRVAIPTQLVVPSMRGNDLEFYVKARYQKTK